MVQVAYITVGYSTDGRTMSEKMTHRNPIRLGHVRSPTVRYELVQVGLVLNVP
jgi:hypothetical protein